MKSVFTIAIIALVSCNVLSGCAEIKVRRVTERDKEKITGFRYYRPDPYLLVTYNDDKKLVSKILWLPNKGEDYSVEANSNLGSAELKLTLTNGWNLTEVGQAKSESKIPETIKEITGAVKEAAAILTLGARGITEKPEMRVTPGLWRFKFGPEGYVTGLVKVADIVLPPVVDGNDSGDKSNSK